MEWRYPRADVGSWGVQIRDTYTLPRWNESTVLHFPPGILFCHFYIYFYFTPESRIQLKDATKLVRDYVHFRSEIYEAAAKIVGILPDTFSTMHFRRGDLQFKENRNIEPATVYSNTLQLLEQGENLYVATDEGPEIFRKDFLSIFEQRYKIIVWANVSHLVADMPDYWIPLIEQLVCTQGRVFVGTRQSTFSGYITRLRGYMKHIKNKNFYWTITNYPDGYLTEESFKRTHHKTWNREYPESWESAEW